MNKKQKERIKQDNARVIAMMKNGDKEMPMYDGDAQSYQPRPIFKKDYSKINELFGEDKPELYHIEEVRDYVLTKEEEEYIDKYGHDIP